jgi:hypothetical protein
MSTVTSREMRFEEEPSIIFIPSEVMGHQTPDVFEENPPECKEVYSEQLGWLTVFQSEREYERNYRSLQFIL